MSLGRISLFSASNPHDRLEFFFRKLLEAFKEITLREHYKPQLAKPAHTQAQNNRTPHFKHVPISVSFTKNTQEDLVEMSKRNTHSLF